MLCEDVTQKARKTTLLSGVIDPALMHTLARMDLLDVLHNVPYFALLEREHVAPLASLFRFEAFASGDVVYRSGERGDSFYILVHGSVELSLDGHAVMKIKAGTGASTFFGATALIDNNTKRTYTVTVRDGAAAMLSLARQQFDAFTENFRGIAADVQQLMLRETHGRMLSSALVKCGLMSKDDIVAMRPDAQSRRFMDLGGLLRVLTLKKGDVVQPAHVPAGAMLVVFEGKLADQYTKDASAIAKAANSGRVYAPGGICGELGLLQNVGRPCDVVAKEGSIALSIDASGLRRLCELVPALLGELGLRLVSKVSVVDLMRHPKAREELRKYLELEHAAESWHFLKEVGEWRERWVRELAEAPGARRGLSADEWDAERARRQAVLTKQAKEMVDTYIAESGGGGFDEVTSESRELNLPSAIASSTRANVKQGGYDETVFDDVTQEIVNLVNNDTLPRFKKDEAFVQLSQYACDAAVQFATTEERDAAIERASEQQSTMDRKSKRKSAIKRKSNKDGEDGAGAPDGAAEVNVKFEAILARSSGSSLKETAVRKSVYKVDSGDADEPQEEDMHEAAE